jgi:hypothetical protein
MAIVILINAVKRVEGHIPVDFELELDRSGVRFGENLVECRGARRLIRRRPRPNKLV